MSGLLLTQQLMQVRYLQLDLVPVVLRVKGVPGALSEDSPYRRIHYTPTDKLVHFYFLSSFCITIINKIPLTVKVCDTIKKDKNIIYGFAAKSHFTANLLKNDR